MNRRIKVNGVLYEAVKGKGKYTEKWWDSLSNRERHGIADAIEASNITADLLGKQIDEIYDALVPWLKKLHITIADFDYSAASEWVECNLDWDEDWYVSLAKKGKIPEVGGYKSIIAGIVDIWEVLGSELEDAVENFKSDTKGTDPESDDYSYAFDDFVEALQYFMVRFSEYIESDIEGLFSYYYDDAEIEAIPNLIEDGVFDEVIDKYLATHGIDESCSRRNLSKSKRNRRSHR